LLVRDDIITEGASSTFCAVFNGCLITHPESNRILSGITRMVAMRLCDELGIPVVEKQVAWDKLGNADELFLLSTIKEIMPIIKVGGTPVGRGKPGPVTRRLQDSFGALVSTFGRGKR
jgi:D-alanine transaminase